tara:strand:+ start:136 stop:588 length:453 start_codon:yes stop_codon:yes gene_type:complete
MAIIDKSRKPFIQDNNPNVRIGLDLPIQLSVSGSSGYFETTSTTIDAIKTNITNLLKTQKGERLMQPNIGLNLKRYLFEPFTEDLQDTIKNEILTTFNVWLPFVQIKDIKINMSNIDDTIGKNSMNINILFNITKDPNSLESVEVIIEGE